MIALGTLALGCNDFDCCMPGVISTDADTYTVGGFVDDSQDLVVNCPMAWTVADLPEWLAAVPDRGDLGQTISLKATQENPLDADPRSAVITFVAANGDRVKVTVTQTPLEALSADFKGLFGVVDNGTIQNLGVEIASGGITGGSYTGGVAGRLLSSSISNSYATGNVSGNNGVGGVAGYVVGAGSSIINCAAFNTSITRTSGANTTFGRVAGWNNSGTLSGNVARDDMAAIGGFSFPAGEYTATGRNGLDVNASIPKATYTGLGWLFNDSSPTPGPWIWDTAGFPKLGFGTEGNPF